MINAKSIIIAILNIIDYQKDKDLFAVEFIDLCCNKALNACLVTLPEEKKEQLNKELIDKKDLDSTMNQILKYVSKEEYQRQLETVSRDTLVDYINAILPTITSEQEEKLRKYLNDLGNVKL